MTFVMKGGRQRRSTKQGRPSKVDQARSTKQGRRRSKAMSVTSICGIILALFCVVRTGRMSHELHTGWKAEDLDQKINLRSAAMDGTNKDPQQQQQPTKPKGRRQNLIQIGANDGIKGNLEQVQKMLNNPDSKAILVEGSPSVFKLLTANVKKRYDPTLERIAPLNALICEEGEKKVFYSVDVPKMMKARKMESYQLPHWVEYQISSLDRSSTFSGLDYFLKRQGKQQFTTNLKADDVIAEELLDCVSFKTILSKAPFDPEEVDVLAVDVEGFDAPVLLESFKLPGLEPDLIIFEWKSTFEIFKKEFNQVMDTLSNRGYKLNCAKSEPSGDWVCDIRRGQDVIARKKS